MIHANDPSLRRVGLDERRGRDQVVENATQITRTTTDVQHLCTRAEIGEEVFHSVCVLYMG